MKNCPKGIYKYIPYGQKFWQGIYFGGLGFESNPPIFYPPKNFTV